MRKAELGGRIVGYELQRTRRRTIGIIVSPDKGLLVRAPRVAAIADIELALSEQTAWILGKLDELAARGLPRAPREFNSGDALFCREEQIVLQLRQTLARRGSLRQRANELWLQVPFELTGTERCDYIKNKLTSWYVRQAAQVLPGLLAGFCDRLGLALPKVKISRGKSRWGSCSSQGVVHLSWRLMLLPVELCDYVVAHEACHLRHFDHSSQFWNLLEQLVPHALDLRQRLNRDAAIYMLD